MFLFWFWRCILRVGGHLFYDDSRSLRTNNYLSLCFLLNKICHWNLSTKIRTNYLKFWSKLVSISQVMNFNFTWREYPPLSWSLVLEFPNSQLSLFRGNTMDYREIGPGFLWVLSGTPVITHHSCPSDWLRQLAQWAYLLCTKVA